MDITPKDSVETKALGHGQRISIAIGILTTMLPAVMAAIGGLDWITANLPLLLGSMGGIVTGGVGAFIAIRRMRIDAAKSALLLLLMIPFFLLTGCSTPSKDQIKAGAGWAKDYYQQPNTAEIINAEGTNITWTISGCTKLVFSTPIPTKSVIPREQTFTDGLFDTFKTIAPWVFMGWAVHDGAFSGGSHTTTTTTAAATP